MMIVIRDDSTQIERFATEELAAYTSAMTGKKAEVAGASSENAIYVGSLPDNASHNERERVVGELGTLSDDGFIIRNIAGSIVIKGKTPRGTLYGVYDYLKLLGARWYFPGKEHEFVPKRKEIFLKDVAVMESPDIGHRSVVIFFRNSAFPDWIDFAAKSKLNAIHLHSDENIEKLSKMLASRGLEYGFRRHFFGDTYSTMVKSELDNDKKLLLDFIAGLPPEINEFFLWPADTTLDIQDGDDLSLPDLVLPFTNEMLDALRTIRPSARMSFLAYWSTWGVPKINRPTDGVFLELAPMFRCFSHSIVDPSCSINASEIHPVIEELLQIFDPAESHVLGYWLDVSLFSRSRYTALEGRLPQMGNAMRRDIQYYKNKGIFGISTFGVGLDKEYFSRFASPSVFQYPALLWDAETDIESELANFCENYYGDRSLVEVFDMDEQLEPNDIQPGGWESLAGRFLNMGHIVKEIMQNATDDNHAIRLERLANELEHMHGWVIQEKEKIRK